MTDLKLINQDALKVQQEAAPEIASHLLEAAELAEKTVRELQQLKHIRRINDPHARSGGAHHYWVAGFEWIKPNSEIVPAAFGYDLQQWKEVGNPTPPWRVLLYAPPQENLISAIRSTCELKGIKMDRFTENPSLSNPGKNDLLWIPIPAEFLRGCDTAPLLAGAVNAFLGSIID